MDRSKATPVLHPSMSFEEIRTTLIKWIGEGGAGVETLCAAKIRQMCMILDQERLEQQLIARIARGIEVEPKAKITREWLDDRLEEAIGDLRRKDHERLEQGYRGTLPGSDAGAFLIEGMGLDPEHAHARIVAYNGLPDIVRRAFFAVAVDLTEFDDLVGTEWKTANRLKDDILTALEALFGKSRNYKRDA